MFVTNRAIDVAAPEEENLVSQIKTLEKDIELKKRELAELQDKAAQQECDKINGLKYGDFVCNLHNGVIYVILDGYDAKRIDFIDGGLQQMDNLEKEIPKYKKKNKSSKSKAHMKSKHKHEYEDCLVKIGEVGWINKGKYCKICGKLDAIPFFETKPFENHPGYRVMLTSEEMLEEYKDLPLFEISDYFTKFVEVVKE